MPLMRLVVPTADVAAATGVAGVAAAPGGTKSGSADASDSTSTGASAPATASLWWLFGSYICVAIGGAVAIYIASKHSPSFTPATGISVFAPFYILAQAIERLIDPLSDFVTTPAPDANGEKPDTKVPIAKGAKVTKAVAVLARNEAIKHHHIQIAADWQTAVDQIRKNTAMIAWAAASVIGMLACAGLGVYMLRDVGFTDVPKWADVVVSGLAVGSGTKPLHDLISNLQSSAADKQDPSEKQAS